jgi:integrase
MSDIRKRTSKNGKTSYQLRYQSEATASGYAYKTFDTMKEAKAFRDSGAIAENNTKIPHADLSVKNAVDKWLEICVTEGTENHEPITRYTEKTYSYRADIMKQHDWRKPLRDLTPVDVREFKSWLLQTCAGRHQAMKVLSSFHTVVQEMALRGLIPTNVVAGISIKMDSRHKKKIVPPTEGEVLELLAASDRLANSKNARIAKSWARYRPILYMAVDTGARPQEYLAAPSRNLNADNSILIDQAIERGGYKISATKTEAGRRVLELSDQSADMVTHYAATHGIASPYGLIFPTSTGHWQQVEHWRERGFYKACEEAGLIEEIMEDGQLTQRPKYTPYDIRHFYASMLIEQQVNLKRIQKLLGHESITTTLNTYGHIVERVEAKKENRSGLVAQLGQKSCGEVVAADL